MLGKASLSSAKGFIVDNLFLAMTKRKEPKMMLDYFCLRRVVEAQRYIGIIFHLHYHMLLILISCVSCTYTVVRLPYPQGKLCIVGCFLRVFSCFQSAGLHGRFDTCS
ncbi:hypothetical protein AQUCO_05500099v1 [Aquilegia coerulea]|uniref:Uncharacterized protein n=1 Tax=Aquilegia coerulea TaxID=218851 RepID=A0A2G5CGY8_AQUCA|nr:hypothetical protein AQUCO_05500089v1 [Aquilegia coerulea]PIA30564.1 hypothetical protein AQUCO_05500099v1 [Aquilegia coerulea]